MTLSALNGENGILANAKNAAVATDIANTIEKAKVEIIALQSGKDDGQITDEEAGAIIAGFDKDGTIKVDEDGNQYILTSKNNKVLVSKIWGGTVTVGSDSETAGGTGNGTETAGGAGNGTGTGEDVDTSDKTPISTSTTYALCYYDSDPTDDVDADGIIYVDLAVDTGKTLSWTPAGSGGTTYSTTITNAKAGQAFKSYYEKEETYKDQKIISAVSGSSGAERFYVMALTDANGQQNGICYDWYNQAYSSENTRNITLTDFGKGKENTELVLEKWNSKLWGTQNGDSSYEDMWGHIKTGWYVPSLYEWVAFISRTGADMTTYNNEWGLSTAYWTSSQYDTTAAYIVCFSPSCVGQPNVNYECFMRLGATF